VRRRIAPATESGRAALILLHGGSGQLDDLVPLAGTLSPSLELVAVEAPRRVHDPAWVSRTYQWFDIQEPGQPEPITFGDSLYQLEQLVYEVSEALPNESRALYLLGYDQGALLALAISLVLPDYLSGVVAVCGCLPSIAAWPLPETQLDGLPVLLIYDRGDPELPDELVLATADEVGKRGGVPTTREVPGARELKPDVSMTASEWLRRRVK
jgi:phospholipase/carboxylesterase